MVEDINKHLFLQDGPTLNTRQAYSPLEDYGEPLSNGVVGGISHELKEAGHQHKEAKTPAIPRIDYIIGSRPHDRGGSRWSRHGGILWVHGYLPKQEAPSQRSAPEPKHPPTPWKNSTPTLRRRARECHPCTEAFFCAKTRKHQPPCMVATRMLEEHSQLGGNSNCAAERSSVPPAFELCRGKKLRASRLSGGRISVGESLV